MKNKKGISMIETVVYVAILAVVSAVVFDMILTTTAFYGRSRVRRNIAQQGAQALERVVREVRLAHSIDYSRSVFGDHPGTLTLNTIVSPGNTSSTTRRFFHQGGNIFLQEGGSSAIPLSQGITITRFVFHEVWGTESGGTTFYVRKSGSNLNSGLSSTTAFATIGKAASVMVAGDTVRVGAGIYNETVIPSQSGALNNPISYIADKNGLYTGDKGAVILNGLNSLCYAFDLSSGKSFLVIDGFEATNYHKCTLEDAAFHFFGGSTNNNIYRNLIAHDTGRDGFVVDGNNNTLENCLTYSAGDDGLEIKGSGNIIRNCTFTKPSGSALESDGIETNIYENNIIDGGIGPAMGNFITSTFNNSDWTSGSLSGNGNIQADPLFINKTGNDFHLSHLKTGQTSDSPALNMGSSTASALGLGSKTTRTDSIADEGMTDMGYHHPNGDTRSRAVTIEITMEAGSGRARTEETLYGTAILRRSY